MFGLPSLARQVWGCLILVVYWLQSSQSFINYKRLDLLYTDAQGTCLVLLCSFLDWTSTALGGLERATIAVTEIDGLNVVKRLLLFYYAASGDPDGTEYTSQSGSSRSKERMEGQPVRKHTL